MDSMASLESTVHYSLNLRLFSLGGPPHGLSSQPS